MQRSLPQLIEISRKYKDQSDKFEIVTIITERVQSWEWFDEKAEHLVKDYWGGPLPFPVIDDPGQKTWRTWEMTAQPTGVLIDPDGNLYTYGHDKPAEALEEILKKAS